MMQLPLTSVVQVEDDKLVAIFEAKTNRRICMLYGNTSSEDAYDIVAAVNERAAMQAEIEHLRKCHQRLVAAGWEAIEANQNNDGWGESEVIFETAMAMLEKTLREVQCVTADAPEEPRP